MVKYENKYTHEYVVAADGSLAFNKCISPEGIALVKKDEQKAKLVRRGVAVLVPFADGKLMERFSMEGDVLTIQPIQKAESGRYTLVERRSGFVLVGYRRGRYYHLKGPKPVELPKSEVVRVVGIVVQRSGTIHFGPKKP